MDKQQRRLLLVAIAVLVAVIVLLSVGAAVAPTLSGSSGAPVPASLR